MFRHERWPSLSSNGTHSVHAPDGLRRSRRLQAELQHPRLVPVIDFFEHDGEWFSVFAQVPDARPLHEIIPSIHKGDREPYSISEFVALSAGVTDGLAAVHRAGFVHRSLGPHNVFVDRSGYVRLSDLGCATPIGADDEAARASRFFMRPVSAAPEQFEVEGSFSPATDNWALGIKLFELRYGRHPYWQETPSTIEEVRAAVLRGTLVFPADIDDSAETMLQPWLCRLLARLPEHRYVDGLEAHRDLQAIANELEGRPPVARAFVAMPFDSGFDSIWRAIRSACAACRVSVTRVDQSHRHESIRDEICDTIRSSDFMIAVASPHSGASNPNVMLEIGFARALQKPVLLLTDAADMLPFDLRTQRALIYRAASIAGGEFHRQLVSFVAGVVARGFPPSARTPSA